MPERVLVVPTSVFHRLGHFQGFTADVARYLPELLSPRHVSYRPRPEVEEDPSYKQLIPYAIFRHVGEGGAVRLFHYTRGKGQGEGRLHSKRSVGIGGHISQDDVASSGESPYAEGMRRELDEEVAVETEFTERCVGLINDDETEVGRVHLGVVHLIDVVQPRVRAREVEILESGFATLDSLLAQTAAFETWSQICLREFFAAGR